MIIIQKVLIKHLKPKNRNELSFNRSFIELKKLMKM
jgi:hypothetical protein